MKNQPCYLSPTDQTVAMLKACIDLGLPMHVPGSLLEAFPQSPPIPLAMLRYVFGPVVIHVAQRGGDGLGWLGADVAKRWRPQVDRERLEILCGERPDIVSPTELWLVMFNATMDAPLQPDITMIYLWAARRSHAASGQPLPDNFLLHGDKARPLATDEQVFDGYLAREYREMCRAIVNKVVGQARSNHAKLQRSKNEAKTTS